MKTEGGPESGRRRLGLGLAALGVLLGVEAAERLGLLARLEAVVPLPLGAVLVAAAGWPVFREVLAAARRRQVTSHTLMTLGALAALSVGDWVSALVVVFFMRTGEAIEDFTVERARGAIRTLGELSPRRATVIRDDAEIEVPVDEVRAGETVLVRNGELVPVDGVVIWGRATVDQGPLTGESLPVEVGPGDPVYAATAVRQGYLRVRADRVGPDTAFSRIIRLVEGAAAHRGRMQRLADRFSAWYLPVVLGVAAGTLVLGGGPPVAAAVLVVACSCAFALATPVAVLAAAGAAARHGILVKGGRFFEALARADVLLIDKTGTLTLGQPQVARVEPADGWSASDLLTLAAAAEAGSSHPVAAAVRAAARERGLLPPAVEDFEEVPGLGVRARVNGRWVRVGRPERLGVDLAGSPGETVLAVVCEDGEDRRLCGLVRVSDSLRPEVPEALRMLRAAGIWRIELLTGDRPEVASALAGLLGIPYRAGLMPEDKLAAVNDYRARGHTVVMVGDGINDAPALAAADAGIAMGTVGSGLAIETAPVVLLREDWRLIPEAIHLARRTVRVIWLNLLLTALYNLAGLSLAAAGILPVPLAAAAQFIPDLLILGNSARLVGWRPASAPAGRRPGL
jgi:Cd2+/Zn2+-exporting ATPase/Cu+-exporting ATPase